MNEDSEGPTEPPGRPEEPPGPEGAGGRGPEPTAAESTAAGGPAAGAPRRAGRWPGWPSRSAAAARPARRPRRPRTGARRLLPTWRGLLIAGAAVLVLAVSGFVAGYLLVQVPEPKTAAAAQNNVFSFADGTPFARVGEVNRQNVDLSEIPEPVQHAVLAAEDRDFYDSSPVDPTAMIRASWKMVRGGDKQSGSTITQQYVKNYYLDQEQTLTRKAKEFFISLKLNREMSREEILEGYLNSSYYGRNAYGIQAAAHAYYAKDAADLTTAEGAYLAALLNSPGYYDVQSGEAGRKRGLDRWEYVLDGMVSEGWLSAEERDELEFPEPEPMTPPNSLSGERGYLVDAVRDYLVENDILSEEQLAEGGYRITTTLEPDRQRALADAVSGELVDRLGEEGADSYVRVGASSVEAETGRVVAMYGGEEYTEQFVNNATRRDYQAASTFKPFVYAAALEHGSTTNSGSRIGPNTTYDGTSGRQVVNRDGQATGWAPENENDESHGEVTVGQAMDKSINAVFAQMGQDVGAERVRDAAVALGLPEHVPGLADADGSLALGTATPSTLDMAGAYATLATHGERHPVVLVDEITRDGEEVELPEHATEQVIPRAAADGTTAVLRSVVEGGTGTAAGAANRPAAGKTGTAEENKAAWFAGYTPDLATVVAVFGQDPETGAQRGLYGAAGESRFSGGGYPARIWAQYTAEALADEPARDFDLDAEEADVTAEPGEDSEGGTDGEDGTDGEESEGGSGETESPAPGEGGSGDAPSPQPSPQPTGGGDGGTAPPPSSPAPSPPAEPEPQPEQPEQPAEPPPADGAPGGAPPALAPAPAPQRPEPTDVAPSDGPSDGPATEPSTATPDGPAGD